jgi:hypothetical protein
VGIPEGEERICEMMIKNFSNLPKDKNLSSKRLNNLQKR